MALQRHHLKKTLPGILPQGSLKSTDFGLQCLTVHLGPGLALISVLSTGPAMTHGDVELQLCLSLADCDKGVLFCREATLRELTPLWWQVRHRGRR